MFGAGEASERKWYQKKRWIIPLGAVLGIIVISSLSSDSNNSNNASNDSAGEGDRGGESESAPDESNDPGLNTPVRDGKFEFVVTGMQCGQTQIGDETFGEKAQGQFCLVSMRVTNIGDEPQTLFGDNMVVFDAEGRKYSADTGAAIYLDESNTFIEEINPGNSLDGTVVFDVPAGLIPVSIELHDSAFSDGVKVRLT